jgi:hypothetical protein
MQGHPGGVGRLVRVASSVLPCGPCELDSCYQADQQVCLPTTLISPALFLKSLKKHTHTKPKWFAGVYETAQYSCNWIVRRKERRDGEQEMFEDLMSKYSEADVNQKDAK